MLYAYMLACLHNERKNEVLRMFLLPKRSEKKRRQRRKVYIKEIGCVLHQIGLTKEAMIHLLDSPPLELLLENFFLVSFYKHEQILKL